MQSSSGTVGTLCVSLRLRTEWPRRRESCRLFLFVPGPFPVPVPRGSQSRPALTPGSTHRNQKSQHSGLGFRSTSPLCWGHSTGPVSHGGVAGAPCARLYLGFQQTLIRCQLSVRQCVTCWGHEGRATVPAREALEALNRRGRAGPLRLFIIHSSFTAGLSGTRFNTRMLQVQHGMKLVPTPQELATHGQR